MFVRLIFLALFLALLGCNEYSGTDCESYDYESCRGVEPFYWNLEILTNPVSNEDTISITLYEGMYSNNNTCLNNYLTTDASFFVNLPLNKDYSVKAEYKRNGKSIYVIDGTRMSKKEVSVCDTSCWSLKGTIIDVRLKD